MLIKSFEVCRFIIQDNRKLNYKGPFQNVCNFGLYMWYMVFIL